MVNDYYRPDTLEAAVALLTDEEKKCRPLGGGTRLSRLHAEQFAVVDLQNVSLDGIKREGQRVQVGAMVRMTSLLEHKDIHPEIQRAIRIDAGENIRNMATLGGWLVSSDGFSILSTALLALDATLTWEPGEQRVRMGNWLPIRDQEPPGVLMTQAEWWLRPHLVFEYAARSPKDRPILIVVAAQWNSGRTRIALGGFGEAPIVAMDGPDDSGIDVACRDACHEAEDQWATAEYRREVAAKFALRCLDRIDAIRESEA